MTSLAAHPENAFERLLSRLEGVKRRGGSTTEAVAMCPAHGNHRTQALSVTYVPEQRRILVKCHTPPGCAEADIMTAAGLEPGDVWDLPLGECEVCGKPSTPDEIGRYRHDRCGGQKRAPQRAAAATTKGGTSRPAPSTATKTKLPVRLTSGTRNRGTWEDVTRYEYTDQYGTVKHAQLRQHRPVTYTRRGVESDTIAKKFLQQRPDDAGGWADGLGDVEPLLYRLPDLLEAIANRRRVFILEGEKDCDRLAELSEVGTTNPGGASNLRTSHASVLAKSSGELLAVLDRDIAGYTRGIKLTSQLRDSRLQLLLPRTTEPHSDLSDHLDAGHGLDQLIPTSVAELERLVIVERITARAEDVQDCAAEAAARSTRAKVAASPRAQQTEQDASARWALEAGDLLRQVCGLVDQAGAAADALTADQVRQVDQALGEAQLATRSAYEVAGVEIPAGLRSVLEVDGMSLRVDQAGATALDPDDEESGDPDELGDELAERRRQRHGGGEDAQPGQPPPAIELPMSRGHWRAELGGPGRRDRGVYQFRDGQWHLMAPIPWIHAKVVSKDGNDRILGHWYIVSGTPEGPRVIIGHDELQRHAWPNLVDLPVSLDDRILKAATTAIVFAAREETEVCEATPKADSEGRITPPPPDTMPPGYLECAPTTATEALGSWARLVHLVARSPRLALMLGASAVAPWVAALELQSHVVGIYGDPAQGKTTAMLTAGSVWGNPGGKSKDGVLTTWNMSKLAPTAFLGEIGNLPAFFDETGMVSNLSAKDWGDRIMSICDGASRGRPAPNGRPGFNKGRSWYSVLFSAGTQRLLAGVGAGGAAGVHRRVIELEAPFTVDRGHAKAIESALASGYGHLGAELIRRHNTASVQAAVARIVDDWADEIERHQSPVIREVIDLLMAHLAGAAMIDEICGTGDTLQTAAEIAAQAFLHTWEQPPHDADLVLDRIVASIVAEPSAWPYRAAYDENTQPWRQGDASQIARHGIAPKAKGFRDDADAWIAVNPEVWDVICTDTGADSRIACAELEKRGILTRQGQRTYQCQIKVNGLNSRWYKLRLPLDDQQLETDEPPTHGAGPEPRGTTPPANNGPSPTEPAQREPVTPPVATQPAEVTPQVTHDNDALTRQVTSVTPVAHGTSHTPPRVRTREGRFSAPAAVLDGHEIELISGREPAPAVSHLGDVALLTRRYRLGWGGGEDRLPDEGQVWLTASTLQQLGLPARLDLPVDEFQSRTTWRAQVRKAFAEIAQLPAVTEAIAAGWQITHLDAWTRIWHPEHREGAFIVVPSWFRIDGVSLLSTDPDDDPEALLGDDLASPPTLVRRLHEFAQGLGISYRITPAATGLDLIDWTRPPRADATDTKGEGRRRYAVVRETPDLPDFLLTEADRRRFNRLEQDFSWWRPYDTLTERERGCEYAVAFDRNRSYLAPWSSIRLGVEGLTHHVGDAAHWDGSEAPGYWLISNDWASDWPWWLPDLLKSTGGPVDDGLWVTTPTLRQLRAVGITPAIQESWTWATDSRYLEPASDALRSALTAATDAAVITTLKKVFSGTVGKLGQAERPQGRGAHLDRPDWRHHIIAQSRLAIQHTLMKAHDLTGAIALVVDRDTIIFAAQSDVPAQAWPGDPTKLGTRIGDFKPAGIAPLAEWGPAFLPAQKLRYRWNYDGMDAMSEWR